MVTRWSQKAQSELKRAYEYIKKESPQNAENVRDGIVERSKSLIHNPERYPLDKYKTNNNGQYRAFEMHKYRISYRIMKDTILIIRMRHTNMSPLTY